MQTLSEAEVEAVGGGLSAWTFLGSLAGIGAAMFAVATAPAWGPAMAGVLAIGAIGANSIGSFSDAFDR